MPLEHNRGEVPERGGGTILEVGRGIGFDPTNSAGPKTKRSVTICSVKNIYRPMCCIPGRPRVVAPYHRLLLPRGDTNPGAKGTLLLIDPKALHLDSTRAHCQVEHELCQGTRSGGHLHQPDLNFRQPLHLDIVLDRAYMVTKEVHTPLATEWQKLREEQDLE